jgi:hypothetical protein
MKKLALLTVGVAIVIVGFMAILYCLPCNNACCGQQDKCEMKDGNGKCGHDEACKDGDSKCSGHEGCENGKENCQIKEWTDADGKCHKEVRVTVGGDGDQMGGCNMQMGNGGSSCNMQMGNHGCCCCCMMMSGCSMGDSAKSDTAHVKVRGKL